MVLFSFPPIIPQEKKSCKPQPIAIFRNPEYDKSKDASDKTAPRAASGVRQMDKKLQAFKLRVFNLIEKTEDGSDRLGRFIDIVIVGLILVSVACLILESFNHIHYRYFSLFQTVEIITVVFFSIEYLLRIWTADLLYPDAKHPRLKYFFSFIAIIDLLAILPFYLSFVSAGLRFLRVMRLFRLFRLLRVFKLGRYFDALQTIVKVIRSSGAQLIMSVIICLFVILVSSIVIYTVEYPEQPEQFPNAVAAMWWAVCTLTTVGYGDIYPITEIGKFFAAIISLVGVGIIAIPTGIVAAGFTQSIARKYEDDEEHWIEALPEEELLALQARLSRKLGDYGYSTTITTGKKETPGALSPADGENTPAQ